MTRRLGVVVGVGSLSLMRMHRVVVLGAQWECTGGYSGRDVVVKVGLVPGCAAVRSSVPQRCSDE